MRIKKTSQYIEGGANLSNEYGTSNENGYTQDYINGCLGGNKSLGNIVVEDVTCKNLLNPAEVEMGKNWGGSSNNARARFTLSGAGTYTVSCVTLGSVESAIALVANSAYSSVVTQETITATPITFTIDSTQHLVIQYTKTSITYNDILSSKVQIEKGNVATSFTPYKNFASIQQISEINDITPLIGQNYANYGNSFYYKIGNRVHIHFGISGLTANTKQKVATLPTDCIPNAINRYAVGSGVGADASQYSLILINRSGEVWIFSEAPYALIDFDYYID